MKFTIDIPDDKLAALDHVRTKHNMSLPDTLTEPRVNHADYCADNAAYLQRVMNGAVASYANALREDGGAVLVEKATDVEIAQAIAQKRAELIAAEEAAKAERVAEIEAAELAKG